MTTSKNSLLMAAAFAGLLTGTAVRVNAAPVSSHSGSTLLSRAGHVSATMNDDDKHACKGQNSCKGKGGCKSGDNGCKGKNSCKGKGGCATDGSK